MPGIGDTKARLLRGIVEDNLDVVQGVRIRRVARRRGRVKISLWIGIIGLAVGYWSVATQGVSREAAPINEPTKPPAVIAIASESIPETEAPLAYPRPIDRNAIPLTLKTVVIDPGHGGVALLLDRLGLGVGPFGLDEEVLELESGGERGLRAECGELGACPRYVDTVVEDVAFAVQGQERREDPRFRPVG